MSKESEEQDFDPWNSNGSDDRLVAYWFPKVPRQEPKTGDEPAQAPTSTLSTRPLGHNHSPTLPMHKADAAIIGPMASDPT